MNNKGFIPVFELLFISAILIILAAISVPHLKKHADAYSYKIGEQQLIQKVDAYVTYMYPESSDIRTNCERMDIYYNCSCVSTFILDDNRVTLYTKYKNGHVLQVKDEL